MTAQALVRADYTFTGPGIAGLLITGIWMGGLTGWDRFQELWLSISLLLIIVIVILWLAVLMPQQRRMDRLAQESISGGSRQSGLPTGRQDLVYCRRYHHLDTNNHPVPDGSQALIS